MICVAFNKRTEKESNYWSSKEIIKFISGINRKVVFVVCLELQRGQVRKRYKTYIKSNIRMN